MCDGRDKKPGTLTFPFHYGEEADSYSFYRIPKILFTNPIFDVLSTDAKLLYGILMDRMQLSIKNGWMDQEDGKVFIYYPVEKIMDALTCGNKKAGHLLAELDDRRGIGLITRIHQGLGKPDKIYVHRCVVPALPKVRCRGDPGEPNEAEATGSELPDEHVQRCQNDTAGEVIITIQDMSKGRTNNTEEIDTDQNNTDRNDTENPSFLSVKEEKRDDLQREYDSYHDYFEDQCNMPYLRKANPYHVDILDEMQELMTEVCTSGKDVIRVGGEDRPLQIVKSRFMKLDQEHLQFALNCFLENTTKVRNIRQYLLTILYNAPVTIGSYYTALVRHDMYGD